MRLKQTSTRATTVFLSLALSLPLLLLTLSALHRPCAPGWSQHLQRDAQAAAAETAALSAAGPPAPFLSPDDVPSGCMRLERVCVDQQMIVMMDERYSAQAVPQLPLPEWEPAVHFNFPWTSGSNPDIWMEYPRKIPPLTFRAAGEREPTPDLQNPVFDLTTLPLLFSPTWQENYGHTLGNGAAWLHTQLHIRNVSWVNRVALVVHTPLGMAMHSFWKPLVGPLAPNHTLKSLADFSARADVKSVEGINHSGRGSARCFAEMLFCSGSQLEEEALNVYQAAQFIFRHYQPSLPASPITYSGHTEASGDGLTRVLRVLFITRSPKVAVRQILNMEELLERCQAWKYTDPASSVHFAAECGMWQPGADLPSNIAAFRSADVVIGRHGAAMANAFFMPEGGALIELFSPGWAWPVHRDWLDQDEQSTLQWWCMSVEDPALLSPGQYELEANPLMYRVQPVEKKSRDANMHVPWAGLVHVLEQYAAVQAAGGWPAYHQRRARGETVSYGYSEKGEIRQEASRWNGW